MNLSVQEIEAKILTLSEPEQLQLIDFVESLKVKFPKKPPLSEEKPSQFPTQTPSPIYLAFEQAGLIGCIETDEQLSTTYKERLDFSFKHGAST